MLDWNLAPSVSIWEPVKWWPLSNPRPPDLEKGPWSPEPQTAAGFIAAGVLQPWESVGGGQVGFRCSGGVLLGRPWHREPLHQISGALALWGRA